MDPLGTLIVSLGTLILLDLAALQLGGSRRSRTRPRAARPRWPGRRPRRATRATTEQRPKRRRPPPPRRRFVVSGDEPLPTSFNVRRRASHVGGRRLRPRRTVSRGARQPKNNRRTIEERCSSQRPVPSSVDGPVVRCPVRARRDAGATRCRSIVFLTARAVRHRS